MAEENGQQKSEPNGQGAETPPRGPGSDASKPITEMTDSERAEYHSRKADRLGKALKPFKKLSGYTEEQIEELLTKANRQDELEAELGSAADKAAAKASKEANAAADAKYRPLMAETAFRIAIGTRKPQDQVDDFIGDLNLARFLTDDGHVDTAKVLARVEQFAPATGTPAHMQAVGPTGGAGIRPQVATNPGDAGRAAAERRFGSKQTA